MEYMLYVCLIFLKKRENIYTNRKVVLPFIIYCVLRVDAYIKVIPDTNRKVKEYLPVFLLFFFYELERMNTKAYYMHRPSAASLVWFLHQYQITRLGAEQE